ncbi:MAG: acylphosphatase [Arenicellales bacterium]
MNKSTRRFIIQGRVQGVGFRYATLRKAKELSLTGWVKNLPGGDVETVAQGEAEMLDEFERWLWIGPDYSGVSRVELKTPPENYFDDFEIHRY